MNTLSMFTNVVLALTIGLCCYSSVNCQPALNYDGFHPYGENNQRALISRAIYGPLVAKRVPPYITGGIRYKKYSEEDS
ncbi:unnamed protein product [Trichobilharzia szidati]|nr:unnamed protein product [Trichobilharzia szidati]